MTSVTGGDGGYGGGVHAGRRWALRAVVVVAVLVTAGCGIGSDSEEEFAAEVQARSGGASVNAVDVIVAGLERELGPDPEIVSMSLTFGLVRASVYAAVPEGIDLLSFTRDELISQDPQEVDPSDRPAPVPLSTFAIDRVEEMADAALEEADVRDAWVTGLQVRTDPLGMSMTVESVRSTSVTVDFTPDGDVIPVLE